MIYTHNQVILALGVFIAILILLVILPLAIVIYRKQRKTLEILGDTKSAIGDLNETMNNIHNLISTNFVDILSKAVVLDSRQLSIVDLIKGVTDNLSIYHTKTVDAVSKHFTPNKPVSEPKPPKQRRNRAPRNSGLNSSK